MENLLDEMGFCCKALIWQTLSPALPEEEIPSPTPAMGRKTAKDMLGDTETRQVKTKSGHIFEKKVYLYSPRWGLVANCFIHEYCSRIFVISLNHLIDRYAKNRFLAHL